MAIRVGINGFGRIGRAFVRASFVDSTRSPQGDGEIEIVGINDLGSLDDLAYLLKYDTVYKQAPFSVEAKDGSLVIDGKVVKFISEKEPAKIPWKDLQVDIVVESTGFFTDYEKAKAHIDAGARRVVISAPVKDSPNGLPAGQAGATVLMGLNEELFSTCAITSNASCTTNSASPVIAILGEALGIEKAILSTTHAYTASQSLVDGPSKKDVKEGRAAGQNIVPTATGAAIAVTQAYPDLVGKFDGISLRVPVAAGSIADITFISKRDTTAEEVNNILEAAAHQARWDGIFSVTREPLVSSDIIGTTFGSVADLGMTRVVGGNLVKVLAWYDNEMGYAHTLVRHVKAAGKHM